jgi:hypothetical protein
MKKIAIFALAVCVLGGISSFASESSKASPYRDTLKSVPAAELPAKAADMVKQAKERDWGSRTVAVVKDTAAINPAALTAVVAAIAKAVPEMAAIAAETAAIEQPKQAAAVAKAAAAAAPAKAGKITAAVCRAAPNDYRNRSRQRRRLSITPLEGRLGPGYLGLQWQHSERCRGAESRRKRGNGGWPFASRSGTGTSLLAVLWHPE